MCSCPPRELIAIDQKRVDSDQFTAGQGEGLASPRLASRHLTHAPCRCTSLAYTTKQAIVRRETSVLYRGIFMIRVFCLLSLLSLVRCAPIPPVTLTSRVAPSAAMTMVLLTPDYPVVRDGVTLPLHTPVQFSAQFIDQQREAFGSGVDAPEDFNRMLRYELGKIEYHEPLTAFGTVSEEIASIPDPATIKFGQCGVTDLFGAGGKTATTHLVEVEGKEVKRGNSLAHDVAELQSGRLKPDDLPIHVFHYVDPDGQPHWVTENNRHLTVFRMAKMLPTRLLVLKRSDLEAKEGDNSLLSVLNRLKALPDAKPSAEMFIRIAGVNDLGEPRQSWDWDAPFGFVVR